MAAGLMNPQEAESMRIIANGMKLTFRFVARDTATENMSTADADV
jgi:hypothetical protein